MIDSLCDVSERGGGTFLPETVTEYTQIQSWLTADLDDGETMLRRNSNGMVSKRPTVIEDIVAELSKRRKPLARQS